MHITFPRRVPDRNQAFIAWDRGPTFVAHFMPALVFKVLQLATCTEGGSYTSGGDWVRSGGMRGTQLSPVEAVTLARKTVGLLLLSLVMLLSYQRNADCV